MNQLNTKIIAVISFIVVFNSSFAQNWLVGGNTNPQLGGNPPNIGTIGNNPLNFLTNNFQRMTINHLAFGMPLVPFSAPPFNNLNSLPGTRLTRVGISYDGGKPDGADL